ncbi:MAG TPA: NADH-quinone oxidoreductase subunit H [Anaerolineales bacterium]|nr:NADH-quinone oxidoreductase subunit H [Anaerolineales bacterium]HNA89008.1 NADH-quinone oxidoreductase subunit H [Anaerolineales bacterium]HNB36426.1 NADH-quinone oxidoreductase subunit H [Anaerolineales bacterium]HNC08356.1 NADH-quinone oxidoreductase subunit H [Anaerolineales bacterium]
MSFWNDPLKIAADWLEGVFVGWGMDAVLSHVLVAFLGVFLLISILMVLDIFLVWIERKVVARFQDRLGPNRVGPFGLIQPFADIIKLIIKEDTTPGDADKVVYNLAPILSMMSVLILWAVIPLAPVMLGTDLNVGVLFLIAAGAIGTLSIIMAGWSSNNKFALIGGFRQVAVMVSFEIPMLTMLMIPTMYAGSMNMNAIIGAQNVWYFILSPLGALIFLIAAIAELGRAPFDLAEGESELVSGFNIEYSGMKFGMFYAGELLHAFTFGGFWAILFFGGYRFFGLEQVSPFLAILILIIKAMLGYWVIMWVKYTMMRIRIDQMLGFNWKFLTPLAFALLLVTALMNALLAGASTWLYVLGMFLANVITGWVALEIARSATHKERETLEGPKPVAEAHH